MPSTPALHALYQAAILQHHRSPRNQGELESPTVRVHRRNPTCGDEIRLDVQIAGTQVEAIRFRGEGCCISRASASMMSRLLEGRRTDEAHAIRARFQEMVRGSTEAAADPVLGDLRSLAGVARHPARVRCAMLAWEARDHAIRGGGSRDEPTK